MPFPTFKGYNAVTVGILMPTFVANNKTYEAIVTDLKNLLSPPVTGSAYAGPDDDDLATIFYLFAVDCANNGTSQYREFDSLFSSGTHKLTADLHYREIAGVIKRHTTLRRFCGIFARPVWNHFVSTNTPPQGYEKKGFRFSERYAAFDFFDAISAVNPLNVDLVRDPTPDEINAQKINAHVAITNSREQTGNLFSTNAVVSGGRSSASSAKLKLPFQIGGLSGN